MEIFWLLSGLLGLWLGTRWVITGAFGISKRFRLSHTFVGLAILAVCTDLPEIFVSISASILHLRGIESSGIITGNAIGSCIAQISIILGIAGLFLNIRMIKKVVYRDGGTLLASILLLVICSVDGRISRLDGIILLLAYGIYYFILVKTQESQDEDSSKGKDYSLPVIATFFVFGFALLIFSSRLVIENAMLLAAEWGVAQSFVGIVLVGLGTSLPELAVSVGAALRKSAGMSIGNIVGSNIFDTLVPIGLGGTISTTAMEKDLLQFDIPVMTGMTLLVILFLRSEKGISKPESIFLITSYLGYVAFKVFFFEGTFIPV